MWYSVCFIMCWVQCMLWLSSMIWFNLTIIYIAIQQRSNNLTFYSSFRHPNIVHIMGLSVLPPRWSWFYCICICDDESIKTICLDTLINPSVEFRVRLCFEQIFFQLTVFFIILFYFSVSVWFWKSAALDLSRMSFVGMDTIGTPRIGWWFNDVLCGLYCVCVFSNCIFCWNVKV
jgi:hypothetical protein